MVVEIFQSELKWRPTSRQTLKSLKKIKQTMQLSATFVLLHLQNAHVCFAHSEHKARMGRQKNCLWSCAVLDLLSSVFLKTKALTLKTLTFLPHCSSLFLSVFLSCWLGPLLPCRSRIKFTAASFFSEGENSQQPQKPCRLVFSHCW